VLYVSVTAAKTTRC